MKAIACAAALFAAAPASAQQGTFSGMVEKVDVMDGVWMTISNGMDTQDFVCGDFSEQCDWNGGSQLGRKIKVSYKFVKGAEEEDPLGDRNEIQRMEWLPAPFDKELNQALCEAQKASRSGNPNAAKINSLGVWHERGLRGLQKNAQKAYEYYQLAAQYGNALAMHNLGDLYRQGKGVPHNSATAFEWYQKAAQADHAIGLEDTPSPAYQAGSAAILI